MWQPQTGHVWHIKIHSGFYICQKTNRKLIRQLLVCSLLTVFRNNHPHSYQAWVMLPVFLLSKLCPNHSVRLKHMVDTVSNSSPLPTYAGSRKSALPHPLWSKQMQKGLCGRKITLRSCFETLRLTLPVIMSETTVWIPTENQQSIIKDN